MPNAVKTPYEEALKLMDSGPTNLRGVAKLLEKAHKLGDPRAAYALGTWYLHGRHFPMDLKKATALIREAAQSNLPSAHFDLAVSYETGLGLRKSLRLAAMHYLKAALHGDAQAVYDVGRCLYFGIGVPANRAMANVWFDRAKELGTYERESRSRTKG